MVFKQLGTGLLFGCLGFISTIVIIAIYDYAMLELLGAKFLAIVLIMTIISFVGLAFVLQKHLDELEEENEDD